MKIRFFTFLMIFVLLTGCSGKDDNALQLSIETTGVNIDDGLSIEDAHVEENTVFISIKNNTGSDLNKISITFDVYDNKDVLLDTRTASSKIVKAGQVFENQIAVPTNKNIAKIKVTKVKGEKIVTPNGVSDELVIQCAQELIEKNLQPTYSVTFVSSKIIERYDSGRYIVDVVLDAENSYGVQKRSGYIINLLSVTPDGEYTYDKDHVAIEYEYNNQYDRENAIKSIKKYDANNSTPTKSE